MWLFYFFIWHVPPLRFSLSHVKYMYAESERAKHNLVITSHTNLIKSTFFSKMTFNHFLVMVVWCLLTIESQATNQRFNMLFVIVDDLPTSVEPYLHPSHPLKQGSIDFTPNIRALAKESVAFHRAYVQYAA